MNLKHVLGRTWALEGETVTGLYRLDGGKCILIDSGLVDERDELARTLDNAGLTPVGVLSTHVHRDHSINNGWLKERYGCISAVPAGEVHVARDPRSATGYLFFYSKQILMASFGDMFSLPDEIIPFEDGVFSFCGEDFRIVHTSGHSEDHVSIITPDGVCCAGDAVYCGKMMDAKLPYTLHIQTAMDSAQKLKALSCPAWILAHYGICDDIVDLADDTCNMLRGRAAAIAELVTEPMTLETLWKKVNEAFSLLSSRTVRVCLMERNLRSFLEYLVDTGVLEVFARDGMRYFAPTGGQYEA